MVTFIANEVVVPLWPLLVLLATFFIPSIVLLFNIYSLCFLFGSPSINMNVRAGRIVLAYIIW